MEPAGRRAAPAGGGRRPAQQEAAASVCCGCCGLLPRVHVFEEALYLPLTAQLLLM